MTGKWHMWINYSIEGSPEVSFRCANSPIYLNCDQMEEVPLEINNTKPGNAINNIEEFTRFVSWLRYIQYEMLRLDYINIAPSQKKELREYYNQYLEDDLLPLDIDDEQIYSPEERKDMKEYFWKKYLNEGRTEE